ncbi:MAG: NAD-dependent succinate-semialdehyde dehydrogenase [Deltaproteobacteria bacterium]|nr:NAD-dependent succinate-semialdehyde dehydrogenase [Deltaproteobacteria bacterium]
MPLQSINPSSNEVIKIYEEISFDEIQIKLQAAENAHQAWRKTAFSHRAGLMKKAGQILLKRKEEFAKLIALEMGKPLKQGALEIEKCALVCDYYAENAEKFLSPEEVKTEALKSYVSFEPIGIVLAIMPWNFPFWQVFRFAVPALMAGNAGVLKHAFNVSGCALAIEDVFAEAGFPVHLFVTLLCDIPQIPKLIEHPLIKAITLTGSTRAGQTVAAQSGRAIKKTVLELGGSDAFLILEDADLDKTVTLACASRLLNAGQSCICAKRFIVVKSIQKEFEQRLSTEMNKVVLGDPFEAATTMGPMARMDLREALHRQVTESILKGAKLLLGGKIPGGKGAYYPPTILTEVKKGMPAYSEELFGPVATIIPVEDEEEAIFVANDTEFGLGAAVFTQDLKRGEEIAQKRLEAGCCYVNNMVRSDPRLPFGGIKGSGYGRELSHFGIREFVNIKTVCIHK